MSKKHILVCDDDAEILDFITQALELHPDYKTISMGTGIEVLNYLKNKKPLPDLMILDLWLPDIDSDEIIPIIRKDDNTRHIPIMLISAIVNVEIIAKSLGIEGFLSKPFFIDELEYKVNQLLKN
ncbi:MAG: PleD family two-component system response regulator [Saprospiraceae bacterium]